MDEKLILQQRSSMPPPRPRPLRRSRHLATILFIVTVIYTFWLWQPLMPHSLNLDIPQAKARLGNFMPGDDIPVTEEEIALEKAATTSEKKLVPLEAHIMSKCPDTRHALRALILPVMQRVHDKVDFTLSYIGSPTANDGVDCKHGPPECLGNILELCARELYPDPKINLGFIMCLSKDYMDIPERALIEDCALEHAMDFKKLNDCAIKDDGAYGMHLLRQSVERSQELGISISCTIRLNDRQYCVRDDGEWKNCPNGYGVNDLVIAIEKLYQQS